MYYHKNVKVKMVYSFHDCTTSQITKIMDVVRNLLKKLYSSEWSNK